MAKSRIINAEQLKLQRNRSHFTQERLAEISKVSAKTINRIECGRTKKVRAHTLNSLAVALGVGCEILLETPTGDPRRRATKHQFNVSLDNATRNALTLVARRYGLKQRDIVAAAPLLLTILAEQSLLERWEFVERADQRPQLKADEYLAAEVDSIEEKDIFGRKLGLNEDNIETDNPFALFLTRRLEEVKRKDAKEYPKEYPNVRWYVSDPSYEVARDKAEYIAGQDQILVNLIINGMVPLHEMPVETRKGPQDERAKWIREKANEIRAAQRAISPEDLNFDSLEFSDLVIEEDF